MATPSFVPVAGIENVTEVVSAAAQTEILSDIDLILALIPDTSHPNAQTTPPEGTSPLYDKWPPELADAMRTELTALKTAIDAAPTS